MTILVATHQCTLQREYACGHLWWGVGATALTDQMQQRAAVLILVPRVEGSRELQRVVRALLGMWGDRVCVCVCVRVYVW